MTKFEQKDLGSDIAVLKDKFGRPLRDLRISVTDRCNFRCTYCMPAEIYGERYEFLPKKEVLTFEEITRLAKIFSILGATKLRITGGEPLIRAELPSLIYELNRIDGISDIALTTNGFLLEKFAKSLKESGLNRITVSLDSLDEEVVKQMNGRNYGPKKTLEGIKEAVRVGLGPVKIDCVVQKGVNDHTIQDMARYFKGTGHIVRFIEYMDVGNRNGWNLKEVVTAQEILDLISDFSPVVAMDKNYSGEVANRYRYTDGTGEIGVISSVSDPFCGSCTRARLSTDGRLVTCLFANGGMDLKVLLRSGLSDSELLRVIKEVWGNRKDQYSQLREKNTNWDGYVDNQGLKKIEMYQIGG